MKKGNQVIVKEGDDNYNRLKAIWLEDQKPAYVVDHGMQYQVIADTDSVIFSGYTEEDFYGSVSFSKRK